MVNSISAERAIARKCKTLESRLSNEVHRNRNDLTELVLPPRTCTTAMAFRNDWRVRISLGSEVSESESDVQTGKQTVA